MKYSKKFKFSYEGNAHSSDYMKQWYLHSKHSYYNQTTLKNNNEQKKFKIEHKTIILYFE
jgi:hypothetical protein